MTQPHAQSDWEALLQFLAASHYERERVSLLRALIRAEPLSKARGLGQPCLAWNLLSLGEDDQALEAYADLAAQSNDPRVCAEALFQQAMVWKTREDMGKALLLFQELSRRFPHTPEGELARIQLGATDKEGEQWDEER